MQCVICKKHFSGYGHNADPISAEGQCCDKCNMNEVIPARISIIFSIMKLEKAKEQVALKHKKGGKAKWKKTKTRK